MVFGIDFDGTFAADPVLFAGIIGLMRVRGHVAVIVTGRSDVGAFGDEVRRLMAAMFPSPDDRPAIVFAGSQWKREAALNAGFHVDVFLDDQPEYIGPQFLLQPQPALASGHP